MKSNRNIVFSVKGEMNFLRAVAEVMFFPARLLIRNGHSSAARRVLSELVVYIFGAESNLLPKTTIYIYIYYIYINVHSPFGVLSDSF